MSVNFLQCTAESLLTWRDRRAAVTHDWLRNLLLPRLQAAIAIGRREASASPAMIDNIVTAIGDWPSRRAEALIVALDYSLEVSPARAARRIAERLPAGVADYVQSVALEAWELRHDVHSRLARVRVACNSADRSYHAWSDASRTHAALDRLAAGLSHLLDLATACDELTAALSDLPADALL